MMICSSVNERKTKSGTLLLPPNSLNPPPKKKKKKEKRESLCYGIHFLHWRYEWSYSLWLNTTACNGEKGELRCFPFHFKLWASMIISFNDTTTLPPREKKKKKNHPQKTEVMYAKTLWMLKFPRERGKHKNGSLAEFCRSVHRYYGLARLGNATLLQLTFLGDGVRVG